MSMDTLKNVYDVYDIDITFLLKNIKYFVLSKSIELIVIKQLVKYPRRLVELQNSCMTLFL